MAFRLGLGIDEVIGIGHPNVEQAALTGGRATRDRADRVDRGSGTSAGIQGDTARFPMSTFLFGRVLLSDLFNVAARANVDDPLRGFEGGGFLGDGRKRAGLRSFDHGFLLRDRAALNDRSITRNRPLAVLELAHGRIGHRHVVADGDAVDGGGGQAPLLAALSKHIGVPMFALFCGNHTGVGLEVRRVLLSGKRSVAVDSQRGPQTDTLFQQGHDALRQVLPDHHRHGIGDRLLRIEADHFRDCLRVGLRPRCAFRQHGRAQIFRSGEVGLRPITEFTDRRGVLPWRLIRLSRGA